jgi:protein TonB
MFEDATFESTGRIRTRSRRWMIATFALNAAVLTALILIPLIYPEALPNRLMSILLTAPPPPAPQTPQAQTMRVLRGRAQGGTLQLAAPRLVPTGLPRDPEGDESTGGPQTIAMDQGSGIPGGDPFSHDSQPTVRLDTHPTGPAQISSGVAAGLLIHRVLPMYPPIARQARVEGTVVLAAVISKYGVIENLRVVSGHPMLQQAAIDAVQQWRYRPYMLNSAPVAVETTVNVIFSLGH